MDTYNTLRQFADSWMLLALTLVFIGVIFWAFRPGGRRSHDEAASSIFRNERKPAQDGAQDGATTDGAGTSGKEGTK